MCGDNRYGHGGNDHDRAWCGVVGVGVDGWMEKAKQENTSHQRMHINARGRASGSPLGRRGEERLFICLLLTSTWYLQVPRGKN